MFFNSIGFAIFLLYWFVANNNIKELKERLILLMEDKNMRNQFGENAFENAKRFLPSEVAKQWDNLYNKIILENELH